MTSFPPNSRYANSAQKEYLSPDGRAITYIALRLLPPPEQFVPLAVHRLNTAERIDQLSNQYYGDPEQYWRICDANRIFWPPDTTAIPEAQVVIPLPLEVSSRGENA